MRSATSVAARKDTSLTGRIIKDDSRDERESGPYFEAGEAARLSMFHVRLSKQPIQAACNSTLQPHVLDASRVRQLVLSTQRIGTTQMRTDKPEIKSQILHLCVS